MESAQNPGYFAPQDWLPTPGLRVAGDRPTGGAHGWLKSAAGRAAGNELRTRKKYVSDRDARFKQPSERCKLLTSWAFEYFDQTGTNRGLRSVVVLHAGARLEPCWREFDELPLEVPSGNLNLRKLWHDHSPNVPDFASSEACRRSCSAHCDH